jgi:hypothetical protein
MLRSVAFVRTDVSEKRRAPIIRVTRIGGILVTLMVGALRFSEMSALTRTTRRNITEDAILHSHHLENVKLYMYWLSRLSSLAGLHATGYPPRRKNHFLLWSCCVPAVLFPEALPWAASKKAVSTGVAFPFQNRKQGTILCRRTVRDKYVVWPWKRFLCVQDIEWKEINIRPRTNKPT